MVDIGVIIVTKDHSSFIRKCIQSVFSSQIQAEVKTVVVDDGSVDRTLEILKDYQDRLNIVARDGGNSLSNNNNIAIKTIKARYYLVMNADVQLPVNGIAKLYEFMEENKNAGACGPKLVNSDGSLQLSCRKFPTPWIFLIRRTPIRWFLPINTGRRQLMVDFNHEVVKQVDWMIGACIMFRAEALEQVGYYDERFRLYCEEIDLCYRLWSHNWHVYYNPDIVVRHDHQLKSLKKLFSRHSFWHYQSMLRYLLKHGLSGFRRPKASLSYYKSSKT